MSYDADGIWRAKFAGTCCLCSKPYGSGSAVERLSVARFAHYRCPEEESINVPR